MVSDEMRTRLREQVQGAQGLQLAYIGVVNHLFDTLHRLGPATPESLAQTAHMDKGYVLRWCEAAYAFGYLELEGDRFCLSAYGDGMRPEVENSLMPMAVQSVLTAHMAERAAGLMRTGERPGESVLAERETVLPWFGPMLESGFSSMFQQTICPAVPAFDVVNTRRGLAVDLGCGNGWYLRALATRCNQLRGLGIDGFGENIHQAREAANKAGLGDRLDFIEGDIHSLTLDEPADLIAMNRALHHVWEKDVNQLFSWLKDNLKAGGYVVIWEPAWPDSREMLRQPPYRGMSFQNLTEHVQGNHFLRPDEIAGAFEDVGMKAHIHLFANGTEAVVVGQMP